VTVCVGLSPVNLESGRGFWIKGAVCVWGGEVMRDDFLPLLNLGKWLLWSQRVLRRLPTAVASLEGLVCWSGLFISTKCGYLGGLVVQGEFLMHWWGKRENGSVCL
jgi:hypothetical protein